MHPRSSRARGPAMPPPWTSALVCVAAMVWLSIIPVGPRNALADGGSGSGSGSVVGDSIEADIRWDSDVGTRGCRWSVAGVVDPRSGSVREGSRRRTVNGVEELLYVRECPGIVTRHWIRRDTSDRMAVAARDRARRLVPTLLTRTAPPAADMVVNVGTWFWVPRAVWKPVRVTATIVTPYGPISVTVTARPATLVWSPGDGGPSTSCRGPGEPWRPHHGDRAATSCMHTYRSASHTARSRTFRARMTVVWKVTWRSSLLVGGSLPDIRTGVGLDVVVRELQALGR